MQWTAFLDHFTKHIQEKPELHGLPPAFVRRAIEEAGKKNPSAIKSVQEALAQEGSFFKIQRKKAYQLLFKESRALLRKQHGMFAAKEQQDRKRRALLLKTLGQSLPDESSESTGAQEKALNEMLKAHPSTAERFSDYERIYQFCFEDGSPRSNQLDHSGDALGKNGHPGRITMLDLGAGMNIASCMFWKRRAEHVFYLAYDLSKEDILLVNTLCKHLRLRGSAKVFDLSRMIGEKERSAFLAQIRSDASEIGIKLPFDICLLWKTADVLEKQQRGATQHLLNSIPARTIVVSFALQSLGQRKQFQRHRPWFEHLLTHEGYLAQTFTTGNELFYKIRKNT